MARYLAHHPGDPLGALDPGLKVQPISLCIYNDVLVQATVMHPDPGKYWLQVPRSWP